MSDINLSKCKTRYICNHGNTSLSTGSEVTLSNEETTVVEDDEDEEDEAREGVVTDILVSSLVASLSCRYMN